MNCDEKQGGILAVAHKVMPGIEIFTRYDRSWLRSDVGAGLSVAAVALPVGIAYADLAGVPAVIGMYSAIFRRFSRGELGANSPRENLRFSQPRLMVGIGAQRVNGGKTALSKEAASQRRPLPGSVISSHIRHVKRTP